ncbi:MAG: 2-hydroxyacyl-CoA dehydratase family protein [Verrucomicrobiota bacterium]|jgi:benzoyl-CoA reductase/2-hydroxyglutaryl-CoA dehydratase subunit BcrC/BadD/HgdB
MDVFLTSPWIPPEWVRAHGLQPRGLGSAENFPPGAQPLSAGICAFAEAAVRFAEARTDGAVIFSTACDQLRRGFDTAILRGQRRAFLFNLPATWQTAAAGRIFRSELERLGEFLCAVGGRAPSPEVLRQEMAQSSRTRERLIESAAASSPRGFAEAVARFHWDGAFWPPPPAAPAKQTPLALVGGPFLAPHWKWLDELEAAGGRIALNATEMGERSLSPVFELEAGADGMRQSSTVGRDSVEPKLDFQGKSQGSTESRPAVTHPVTDAFRANHAFDALVRGYCENIVDVFQRPNTRLYSWLKTRLESRQARGIVLWLFTGCDLWRAEAQTLRETFGLPVLLLEAGAEPAAAPRELNRLQAFAETLR